VADVEAFDVLADPVRRRVLELLSTGERTAGEVASVVTAEFGLTQPAASRHLRVLRENGFANVRAVGTQRVYALEATALDGVESWLADVRARWNQHLDALETELARGRRSRRAASSDLKHREERA
jgi:DNA-binding transcriptional ArsR family regulator